MNLSQKITPCLWFDSQAEEAAEFYTSIFPNSKILQVTRYGEAGHEVHGQPAGKVLTVSFDLDGNRFVALNGGPLFQFNEAVSFQVHSDTQDELDYFWTKLTEGGDPAAQQCGWLKDRFGVSWQIVPAIMPELLSGDYAATERVMTALLKMQKLDIAELQRAHG